MLSKTRFEICWMCNPQVQNKLLLYSLPTDTAKHNAGLSPHSIWIYTRIRRYTLSARTSCCLKFVPVIMLPLCHATRVEKSVHSPAWLANACKNCIVQQCLKLFLGFNPHRKMHVCNDYVGNNKLNADWLISIYSVEVDFKLRASKVALHAQKRWN